MKTTIVSLLLILIVRLSAKFRLWWYSSSRNNSIPCSTATTTTTTDSNNHQKSTFEIISSLDLKSVMEELDDTDLNKNDGQLWVTVIDRSNSRIAYRAQSCKPKDGPLKYLSVTTFENCSAERLRDFYMDNDYRKKWDKTLVDHEQLEVDESNSTEIGRMIKKFPLLTSREYVLAWRVWESKDGSYYCLSKECEHPLAPRQKKYVRVKFFRSGWCIRQGSNIWRMFYRKIMTELSGGSRKIVPYALLPEMQIVIPGRNASEIRMVHQEDAGLNVEMAKLAFSKGIWSYVSKMDDALRKYLDSYTPQSSSGAAATTLTKKVPTRLNTLPKASRLSNVESPGTSVSICQNVSEDGKTKCSGLSPKSKLIANGLIVLGGVVCLSRGHSSLGAKVAMAYILTKLSKRNGAMSLPSQPK